jgi:hypothetical protein
MDETKGIVHAPACTLLPAQYLQLWLTYRFVDVMKYKVVGEGYLVVPMRKHTMPLTWYMGGLFEKRKRSKDTEKG